MSFELTSGMIAQIACKAACWWAKHIPCIDRETGIQTHGLGLECKHVDKIFTQSLVKNTNRFTKLQVERFGMRLIENIIDKIPDWINGPIRFGNRDSYGAPDDIVQIFNNVTDRSGSGSTGIFPGKTEMLIYPGYITVNSDVIYTDDCIRYLCLEDVDFTKAEKVKISGRGFRVLRIDMSKFSGDLYISYSNPIIPIEIVKGVFYDELNHKPYDFLYTKIKFSEFVGGEEALQKLSDEELLTILQNKEEFMKHIEKGASFYYHGNYEDGNIGYFYDVGTLLKEEIDNHKGAFHYTTGVVLSVPASKYCSSDKICMIKNRHDRLIEVTNDHILIKNHKNELHAFGMCDKSFKCIYL